MSKPKFTPGPWVTAPVLVDEVETPMVDIYEGDTSYRLAVAYAEGSGDVEANAALISAAPDMYHALKVAQKWVEFAKEHCGLGQVAGGDWYIDQENIRKALAKAEGRDNE